VFADKVLDSTKSGGTNDTSITLADDKSAIITTKANEQKSSENKTNQQTPNQSIDSTPESHANSLQEQISQQITSLLHFKSVYLPLEMNKKQIVEYSIIAAIILVMIIVIASSARSKNKKLTRK